MISLSNFEPYELGLPEKFSAFRREQLEAGEQVLNSQKRFQALCLPTGSGKTLTALAIAKSLGVRTVILTSTLGLQQQYLKDFADMGLTDIRGKSNYTCSRFPQSNCKFGPHEGCHLKAGCSYEVQRSVAKHASLVITNYSYWIRVNDKQPGLELGLPDAPNPFGLIILDEAHKAVEELSSALQVKLLQTWLKTCSLPTDLPADINEWREFAVDHIDAMQELAREWGTDYRKKKTILGKNRVYACEQIIGALEKLAGIRAGDWVCELRLGTDHGKVWTFDPIWPGNWKEKLFQGVGKVVLMSATLRPIVMSMLGVPKSDYDFTEWPRVFPPQNTPVYHVQTARMNFRSSQEDIDKWVGRIDEVIQGREDRKGIVHTVSYSRQQYLMQHSKFAARMLANTNDPTSESASEVVERFRGMGAPAILVSPSFSTGWDFPGEECEYQIISKLPFPDGRGALMKARLEKSPQYGSYLTMQDLVQSCGRGTRSATDKCEVFIVDDNISWFLYRNKGLAPRWFEVMSVNDIPKPPAKAQNSTKIKSCDLVEL